MVYSCLELFSGTGSFTKVMRKKGFHCVTVDNESNFGPDICKDIMQLSPVPFMRFNVVWASPPCQCFSVASISKHWKKPGYPKSEEARDALGLLKRTINLIAEIRPNYWFIENPRGMMRNEINRYFWKHGIFNVVRRTVTYCQYGETRMKPTDIWTNLTSWKPRPACKNGDDCHTASPRGTQNGGTQGIPKGPARSVVPAELCAEIADAIMEELRYA